MRIDYLLEDILFLRSSSHSQQSLIWLLSEFGSRMEFNADGDDSFVDVDVSSSSGLCEHSSMYGWLVVWC